MIEDLINFMANIMVCYC